ncbi:MAG: Clp protease ClpP [Clostridia bacterium]|nr:Clp protease ClpP [Clostridia bacterium]
MSFWKFGNKSAEEAELWIDGDIVDDAWAWLYQWYGIPCASPNRFREELSKVEGKRLTVYIDSYGGDVFAAAGIYDAIKNRKGVTKCVITGKAMSAATVIAMAGKTVEMSPTAIFMIHNPLTYAEGYASDLRKVADVLDTVKETIMNAYVLKTGNSRQHISQMMDEETYMSAKRAQKEGFVDNITLATGESVEIVNFAFPRTSILNSCGAAVKKLIDLTPAPPPGPEEDTAAPAAPDNSGEPEDTPPGEPAQEEPEGPDAEAQAKAEAERNRKNSNMLRFLEVIENAGH